MKVHTVHSASERDRAITAAITDGAAAVKVVEGDRHHWVLSRELYEAILERRRRQRRSGR
jgi:hypothetical protein